MASREITDPEEARKQLDYRQWFSDAMVKEYLPSFNQRWKKAKNGKEMQLILKEATMVVLDYSVLVYYMYEKSADLRNAVKNNKELKGNFDSVKKWLDAEGTKKYAASYVETVAAAAKNSR